MRVAYMWAEVEREGDTVTVRMNEILASRLADWIDSGQKVIETEFGSEVVEVTAAPEWVDLAAELRTA